MRAIDAALVALQRSVTPEDLWSATRRLLTAATPGRYYVLGVPSLGITPMFLRTTMPMRNMARFAELAPLNRVIATKPGVKVARMSDFYDAVPGDPFHDEFLVPDGWMFAAAQLFWDRDRSFMGQLASLRTRAQGDFTKAELRLLGELYPHVNAAISRLLELQHAAGTQVTLEHSLHALPLPLVAVSWDLSVRFANQAGHGALHAWVHGSARGRALKTGTPRLPPDLHAACVELKASVDRAVRTAGNSSVRREHTVTHAREPRLVATFRLVEPAAGRALHPSWIIHFETMQAPNGEVARALHQFTKLSPTEKTVVIQAAAGHNNDAIAARLGRSRSTIRTHLRNTFRKLGITSRTRLAPLLHALQTGAASRGTQTRRI